MCNEPLLGRHWRACICRNHGRCLQSYDRLERQYDAIVAIESLGHSANVTATLHHWASHLRPGGVVVIIDELFRPEVSPTNPEIQKFMRSLHFSLLLQQAPLEAMLHAAGLSVLAWVLLSERYHVHTRSDEECDRLLHAYHLDGVHQGYIGGMLLEKFYNRGWVDYVLLVLTSCRSCGCAGRGSGARVGLRCCCGGSCSWSS